MFSTLPSTILGCRDDGSVRNDEASAKPNEKKSKGDPATELTTDDVEEDNHAFIPCHNGVKPGPILEPNFLSSDLNATYMDDDAGSDKVTSRRCSTINRARLLSHEETKERDASDEPGPGTKQTSVVMRRPSVLKNNDDEDDRKRALAGSQHPSHKNSYIVGDGNDEGMENDSLMDGNKELSVESPDTKAFYEVCDVGKGHHEREETKAHMAHGSSHPNDHSLSRTVRNEEGVDNSLEPHQSRNYSPRRRDRRSRSYHEKRNRRSRDLKGQTSRQREREYRDEDSASKLGRTRRRRRTSRLRRSSSSSVLRSRSKDSSSSDGHRDRSRKRKRRR